MAGASIVEVCHELGCNFPLPIKILMRSVVLVQVELISRVLKLLKLV